MKLTLEEVTNLAYWIGIAESHAKNYQGMLTFSEHPDIFHKSMMRDLRKPLENMLKSLPAELLAEINGNVQVEVAEPLQGATERRPASQDFAVFNDVASVLGHAEAEKQLQLVIGADGANPIFDGPILSSTFDWRATPQGWDYWFNVSAEIEILKA